MAVQLPDAPRDRRRCEFCKAHVTDDFRRTFGTEDHLAKRCPECDSWARIERGSAHGTNVDRPDPQENKERAGGRSLRTPVLTDGGDP